MHYKNGREAKNGDPIVFISSSNVAEAGILYAAVGTSDTCNGRLAKVSSIDPYLNLKDCLHIADIAAAEIPDKTKL